MRPLLFILLAIIAMYLIKIFVIDDSNEQKSAVQELQKTEKSTPKALPVSVYVAAKVQNSNTVFTTGTIIPNEEVDLKMEVSGRVVQLNIIEGGQVRKGQLIAKLNADELEAQINKVEFEEQMASQTQARQQKLLEIDAISKEEYDIVVTRVNTLSADKELLNAQLEKTSLVAPFHGKIGLKNISTGAYITPSQVIATLVQTDPIKIDFTLPEKYANKILVGQEVSLTIDGKADPFTAKVIALDSKIDENLRTLRVRAKTNNQSGQLYPGMFVRVEVNLGDESSIMIPTEAIIPILKGKKVFVIKNGKAKEIIVETGLRTDTKIEVDKGLEVGDSVIISALMTVKAKMAVMPKEIID
jgi:membrane fusion protein (multidrug efflux system)